MLLPKDELAGRSQVRVSNEDLSKVRPILEQIANKWSVLIMTVLCAEPLRFNEIMRRMDGITHKALADALKRLERNGLISRHVLSAAPVGVEYSVTTLGRSLREPFGALYSWAVTHASALDRAQIQFDSSRG